MFAGGFFWEIEKLLKDKLLLLINRYGLLMWKLELLRPRMKLTSEDQNPRKETKFLVSCLIKAARTPAMTENSSNNTL